MFNPQTIAAASFWSGLQNVGQTYGTAYISGTLYASPSGISPTSSNMTGTIFISLPDPTVISIFRVNFPDADGELATRWFPLFGTLQIYDTATPNDFKLIMTIGSAIGGRNIYLNFVNAHSSSKSFSGFRINIYGHLFTYPWG
jgi:hypothetical protein